MDEQELESVPRGAPHPLRSSTRCHTHSSHGEKTHARLIPAAPAHYFLAVILWIQVKVSRCLHSPKQLTSVPWRLILMFEYFRFNIAFRAGTNLKTNRHITRQPETGMWWMWGQHCAVSAVQSVGNLRRRLLHAIIQVCNMDKYIKPFGQKHVMIWTNTLCNLGKYIL